MYGHTLVLLVAVVSSFAIAQTDNVNVLRQLLNEFKKVKAASMGLGDNAESMVDPGYNTAQVAPQPPAGEMMNPDFDHQMPMNNFMPGPVGNGQFMPMDNGDINLPMENDNMNLPMGNENVIMAPMETIDFGNDIVSPENIENSPTMGNGYMPAVPGSEMPLAPSMPEFGYTYPAQNLAFPGSDFIMKFVEAFLMRYPSVDEIIDEPSFDAAELKHMPNIEGLLTDPDSMALLYTRFITRTVLYKRVNCPAAMFDRIMARVTLAEMDRLLDTKDQYLQHYLVSMLTPIAAPNMDPTVMAEHFTSFAHHTLFNETLDYIMSAGYVDVAQLARTLYDNLKMAFKQEEVTDANTVYDIAVRIVQNVFQNFPYHCPTAHDVMTRHTWVARGYTQWFERMESDEICERVRGYFMPYFSSSPNPDVPAVFEQICQTMTSYVHEVINFMYQYEAVIMERNARDLGALLMDHLTPDQLDILQTVLEHLDWTMDGGAPGQRLFNNFHAQPGRQIPLTEVVEFEQNDLQFWKSFLSTMTEQTFQEMTLTQFTTMLNDWMTHKQEWLTHIQTPPSP